MGLVFFGDVLVFCIGEDSKWSELVSFFVLVVLNIIVSCIFSFINFEVFVVNLVISMDLLGNYIILDMV